MKVFRGVVFFAVISLFLFCSGFFKPKAAETWIEDSFADFVDGTFDSSGQNLYATHNGTIKTIHRFDLNSDGYHDLVFNSSHDFSQIPKATSYTVKKGQRDSGAAKQIPMPGSFHAAVADLNKDGMQDIVFTPNHNWASPRRYTRIFWGSKEGWTAKRMTNLVSMVPKAIKIADINGDSWLDILILNGSRWAPEDGPEKVLRIYWGDEEGFKQNKFRDVVVGNAHDMAVDDFDGDGRADIAIRQQPIVYDANGKLDKKVDAEVVVYWNDGIGPKGFFPEPEKIDLGTNAVSKINVTDFNRDGKLDFIVNGGEKELYRIDPTTKEKKYNYLGFILIPGAGSRQWGQSRKIKGPRSSSTTIADMDKDGWDDIVVSNSKADSNSIQVLWGGSAGTFDEKPAAKIAIGHGSGIAVADLDGDGNLDVAVGVSQNETGETYQGTSRIFYGDGKGGFEMGTDEIATASVTEVVIAPTDEGDGHRIIFCSYMWGRINEDVPVYVYWGGKKGFDKEKLSKYHIRSGYASNASDLNDDGYPDLILASIVHNVTEAHPERGFNILWGDRDGLKDDRRTVVNEYGMTCSNVADFDKDGYLDLLGSCSKVNDMNEPQRVVIWYGGAKGFEKKRRVVIPCSEACGPNVVADFNKDGWLDIAASRLSDNRVSIFYGSAEGFSEKRESSFYCLTADDISSADLNGDGWLELIVTSYNVPKTENYDYGTNIFWGSPEGFSSMNRQRMRGSAGCGISVADYDADGYLDIHIPNYKWTEIRESIQSFLFWGSPDGYSDNNRTSLLVDSGHATHSADFNGDGLIDLAISCHSIDGEHYVNSRVYYNDGERFVSPKCQLLPTAGPHYMHRADVGNQYDRSYKQRYVSSVYKWEGERKKGRLSVKAKTPGKSRLIFHVRSATTEAELAAAEWSKPVKRSFSLGKDDRYMQYKAIFVSDNGDRYPVLDRVAVSF